MTGSPAGSRSSLATGPRAGSRTSPTRLVRKIKTITRPNPGGSAVENFNYHYQVGEPDNVVAEHIDADGSATEVVRGPGGRVIRAVDGNDVETCYDYEPFGMLESVQRDCGYAPNSNQPTTSYTYDDIGRRLTESDPSFGTRTYTYTGFGEVETVTESSGNHVSLAYDDLGRLVSRTDADGTSSWTYDGGWIGALTHSSSVDGVDKRYIYDEFGRLTDQSTWFYVEANLYMCTFQYGYESGDRLGTINYPTEAGPGLQLSYSYDVAGYLRSIDSDSFTGTVWGVNETAASGQYTRETFGNGVVTSRDYYAESLRPWTITSVDGGGSTLQALDYQWSPAGDLLQRNDPLHSQVETYTYDPGHRLDTHTVGGQTVDVDYDAVGNITSKTDIGAYNYDGLGRLDTVGLTDVTHDLDGNIYRYGDNDIVWTPHDMVRSVLSPTESFTYRYDADDSRVVRTNSDGSFTVTVNELYEQDFDIYGNPSDTRLSIPDGAGRIVATVNHVTGELRGWQTTYQFQHADHLGSSSVVTDAAAGVVEKVAYGPWGKAGPGEDWTATLTNAELEALDIGFTGHQPELESGFLNMRGRMYVPGVGRFLTPDPIIGNPLNGQSWNSYSYVDNRPTVFVDPTGWNGQGDAPDGPSDGDFDGSPEAIAACEARDDCRVVHVPTQQEPAANNGPGQGGYGPVGGPWGGNQQDRDRENGVPIDDGPASRGDLSAGDGSDTGPGVRQPSAPHRRTYRLRTPGRRMDPVCSAGHSGACVANSMGTGIREFDPETNRQHEEDLIKAREKTYMTLPAEIALMFVGEAVFIGGIRLVSLADDALRTLPKSGLIPRSLGAASRAEMVAKRVGLNVNSPTSRQILNSLDMKVTDFIGQFRRGAIRRKFPSEFLERTVEDALLEGGSRVRKLLMDTRFIK